MKNDGTINGSLVALHSGLIRLQVVSRLARGNVWLPGAVRGGRLNLSTSATPIDPWGITGITDAEGSFSVSITESKGYKRGWVVGAE